MPKKKERLRILFIGNSHTYYHDLPAWVEVMAKEEQYECEVTMLAHPGWYLKQHVQEPDVNFNIRYGHYDYVVLQEHSHPFDCIPDYQEAAATLSAWIHNAGSTPVIYGTWSRKDEPDVQAYMNEVNRKLAEEIQALLSTDEVAADYERLLELSAKLEQLQQEQEEQYAVWEQLAD